MLFSCLQILVGMLMAACWAYSAAALARRWIQPGPVSVRWAATAAVGWWLLAAVFEVLASLRLFRLDAALAVWLILALCLGRLDRGRPNPLLQLWDDLQRLDEWIRAAARRPVFWVIVFSSVPVALILLRGLIAPPMAWDTLTYHLFKAGRFVQSASFVHEPAPHAWSYYEHFPYMGDTIWAWAMLPLNSDALLTPAGFCVWLCVLLAVYATARTLDVLPSRALMAAWVVGLTPAVAAQIPSGYVDNQTLALTLLGILFLIRVLDGHVVEAPIALASLGLAVGVKATAATMLLLGLLIVLWSLKTAAGNMAPRRLRLIALAGACALVPGGMPFLQNWFQTGSPLYPWPITVLGRVLFAGNEQFKQLLNGQLIQALPWHPVRLLKIIWRPLPWDPGFDRFYLGLGLGTVIVLALAVPGLIRLLRKPGRRIGALLLLATALAFSIPVLCPEGGQTVRTIWLDSSSRFMTPAMASVVVLAAIAPCPAIVWGLVLLVQAVAAIPGGFSTIDAYACALALAAILPAGIALSAAARWIPGRRVALAVVTLAVLLSALALVHFRDRLRYRMYEAVHNGQTSTLHPLETNYVAWPIWQYADAPPRQGHRIAFVAGWDGVGHNWYRYPLMGSRLQNEVRYVPITSDGAVVSYKKNSEALSLADYPAWLARLTTNRIDLLVIGYPADTIERNWADGHPEVFHRVAEGMNGDSVAYRVAYSAAQAGQEQP